MGLPESKNDDDPFLKAGEEGRCERVSIVRSDSEGFGALIWGVSLIGEVAGDKGERARGERA